MRQKRTLIISLAVTMIALLGLKHLYKSEDPTFSPSSSSETDPEITKLKTSNANKPGKTSASATIVRVSELQPAWKFLFRGEGEDGTGKARDSVILFHDLCIPRFNQSSFKTSNGLFYVAKGDLAAPKINVAASADSMDVWLRSTFIPLEEGNRNARVLYQRNKELFVMGQVWSYHLSHFMINNVMPLMNSMQKYYNYDKTTTTEWDWKSDFEVDKPPRDLFLATSGGGTNYQDNFDPPMLPVDTIHKSTFEEGPLPGDYDAICYQNVIIGLNNTCDCCGCLKDYPSDVRPNEMLRYRALKMHLTPEEFKIAEARTLLPPAKRPFHLVIIDRLKSRSILNLEQVTAYLNERNTSYSVVILEGKSTTEQIKLFSLNATAVLAAHGNALGNSLWLAPGSVVIEVHSYEQGSAWFEHIFSDWSSGRPSPLLEYFTMKCKDKSCMDPNGVSFNAKVFINLDKLDLLLDKYEGH